MTSYADLHARASRGLDGTRVVERDLPKTGEFVLRGGLGVVESAAAGRVVVRCVTDSPEGHSLVLGRLVGSAQVGAEVLVVRVLGHTVGIVLSDQ